MPQSWSEDRARCQQADIPDEITFATKPALALAMLQRAVVRAKTGEPGWAAVLAEPEKGGPAPDSLAAFKARRGRLSA